MNKNDYKKKDKEIKKIKLQLKKENTTYKEDRYKHSNKKNISYMNINFEDAPVKFDSDTYISVLFTECKFGETNVFKEEDMYNVKVNFWGVTFERCIFQNISFNNSSFHGCKFTNCKFGAPGVIFENCEFTVIDCKENSEGEIVFYNIFSEFEACNIFSTRFRNSNLENMIFDENYFSSSTFMDCKMNDCIFDANYFGETVIKNCNILNLNILNMRRSDIEFHFTDQEKDTNLYKKIYVSKMGYKYKDKKIRKDNYAYLAKMYYTLLEYLQKRNLDTDNMSEYRYLYSYYSMLSKQNLAEQLWDRISWITCGFGERMRSLYICFLCAVLLPAIGYMFSGIKFGEYGINYDIIGGTPVGLSRILDDFGMCLHFSIVTFSTVGYGNIVPDGRWSYIISASQILSGMLFLAVFTSVTLKKILK